MSLDGESLTIRFKDLEGGRAHRAQPPTTPQKVKSVSNPFPGGGKIGGN